MSAGRSLLDDDDDSASSFGELDANCDSNASAIKADDDLIDDISELDDFASEFAGKDAKEKKFTKSHRSEVVELIYGDQTTGFSNKQQFATGFRRDGLDSAPAFTDDEDDEEETGLLGSSQNTKTLFKGTKVRI